jgi:hypothetical protein
VTLPAASRKIDGHAQKALAIDPLSRNSQGVQELVMKQAVRTTPSLSCPSITSIDPEAQVIGSAPDALQDRAVAG